MRMKQVLISDALAMLALLTLSATLPLSERVGQAIVSKLSTTLPAQATPRAPLAASSGQLSTSRCATLPLHGSFGAGAAPAALLARAQP